VSRQANIEIDFTGDELILIGGACKSEDITFSEFIDRAIRELVDNISSASAKDGVQECTCRFDLECECGLES